MKTCTKCNKRSNGLKRFAFVDGNLLKIQKICNECKLAIAASGTKITKAGDAPNIKDIIKKFKGPNIDK